MHLPKDAGTVATSVGLHGGLLYAMTNNALAPAGTESTVDLGSSKDGRCWQAQILDGMQEAAGTSCVFGQQVDPGVDERVSKASW